MKQSRTWNLFKLWQNKLCRGRLAPVHVYSTSLNCRSQTRVTSCVTSIVLHTQMDAECNKLATVVGRTNMTTLDVPWRHIFKSRVWSKVPEKCNLFLEIPEFIYNADYSGIWNKSVCRKNSAGFDEAFQQNTDRSSQTLHMSTSIGP